MNCVVVGAGILTRKDLQLQTCNLFPVDEDIHFEKFYINIFSPDQEIEI